MINYIQYIEDNTLRCEASYRGGGIEISLDNLLNTDGYRMTAYQNYLGGGMLGSIQNSYNFDTNSLNKRETAKLNRISLELCKYFHNLTNHEDDEWESASFEQNQARPASAY